MPTVAQGKEGRSAVRGHGYLTAIAWVMALLLAACARQSLPRASRAERLRAASLARAEVCAPESPGCFPTREQVVTAMRDITPDVQACLRHFPRGPLIVCLEFESKGSVTFAGLSMPGGCEPLSGLLVADPRNRCLRPALEVARLPPFEARTFRVSYPFDVGVPVQLPPRDAGWYARRHGSCAAPLPSPERRQAVVHLNVASIDAPHVSKGAQAAAQGVAGQLDARRSALGECLQDDEHIELWLSPGTPAPIVEPLCVAARSEAVSCLRQGLASLSVFEPLGISLGRPTSSNGPPRTPDDAGASKARIKAVIDGRIEDVRKCYEDALSVWPDTEGRVSIKFIISSTGAVQASTVESSTPGVPPEVACCIRRAVLDWSFDRPAHCGIVVVSYPFILQS